MSTQDDAPPCSCGGIHTEYGLAHRGTCAVMVWHDLQIINSMRLERAALIGERDKARAEVVALRDDALRYRWLMDVWDEACPFANGLPLWDYDSSMVNAAIDHERLAEKDKGC